jgi:hypothetical protein
LPIQHLNIIAQHLSNVLVPCHIHEGLISIMTDLAYFCAALASARSEKSPIFLDPIAYSEDMFSIEHRLLSFPNLSSQPSITNACRLGALLYIKTILEEFPHSKYGSTLLLQQLRMSLNEMLNTKIETPVLIWLNLIGASLSTAAYREWHVDELTALTSNAGIPLLVEQGLAMSKALPLQAVFENLHDITGERLQT